MGFLIDLLKAYFSKPPPAKIDKQLLVRVQKLLTVKHGRRVNVKIEDNWVFVDGIGVFKGSVAECHAYLCGLEQGAS